MQRQAGTLKDHSLWGVVRQHLHVRRRPQSFGDLAGSVVVAIDEHHTYACLPQRLELPLEEECSAKVVAIAVVEIAGDDEAIYRFVDGGAHEILEGTSCGQSHLVYRRILHTR